MTIASASRLCGKMQGEESRSAASRTRIGIVVTRTGGRSSRRIYQSSLYYFLLCLSHSTSCSPFSQRTDLLEDAGTLIENENCDSASIVGRRSIYGSGTANQEVRSAPKMNETHVRVVGELIQVIRTNVDKSGRNPNILLDLVVIPNPQLSLPANLGVKEVTFVCSESECKKWLPEGVKIGAHLVLEGFTEIPATAKIGITQVRRLE